MSLFRIATLWLLVLALPAQSWAAVSMAHCKDMQSQVADEGTPAHHDHAAMMRQMAAVADADHGDHHGHHAMPEEQSEPQPSAHHDAASDVQSGDAKAKTMGCECGCECSGNCAMTCAASVSAFAGQNPLHEWGASRPIAAALPSQAMAAHRFTPLRPPSAAAL